MLSIQVVRGLPRLRAPGTVPGDPYRTTLKYILLFFFLFSFLFVFAGDYTVVNGL